MQVKILENDDRFGIKAGEVYEAKRYWLDPTEKVTLLGRVPDGWDPGCNQYTHSVAFLIQGRWMVVSDSGEFVSEAA